MSERRDREARGEKGGARKEEGKADRAGVGRRALCEVPGTDVA